MYEIEITRFQLQPTLQKFSVAEAAEASTVVSGVVDETAVIYVADIRDHVDYGNFYVWLCAGRAYVRLDEHREHYGSFRDVTTIPHVITKNQVLKISPVCTSVMGGPAPKSTCTASPGLNSSRSGTSTTSSTTS